VAKEYNLVIRKGTVIDGTGAAPREAGRRSTSTSSRDRRRLGSHWYSHLIGADGNTPI